ncbi:MAG TPA: hypothetical protein VIN06_16840 [Devosia sp.]
MRADRRVVLIDRLIPFLAALVGLVALAGAVVVQSNVTAQNDAVRAEIAATRNALDLVRQGTENLSTRLDSSGEPADDGTAEALLALQERMVKLEEAAKAGPLASPAPLSPAATTAGRPVDPNLPTDDCIPQGTRFMVTLDDGYPVCQSTVTIKASAISAELVALDNGVTLVPGTPSPLPGGGCTASLFSADPAGFAELRVDCR